MKKKFTIRKLDLIRSALLEIAEMQELTIILRDSSGAERQEQRRDRLVFNGILSLGIRQNLGSLDEAMEPVIKAKEDLVRKHSQDGKIDLSVIDEARKMFLEEWDVVLDAEREIELFELSESDFNLDKNNIPIRLMLTLRPILKETKN